MALEVAPEMVQVVEMAKATGNRNILNLIKVDVVKYSHFYLLNN